MKHRIRLGVKWLGACGALLVIAGIVAPYWSADRFAERIRSGIESALGRRVELGDVRFNLFTGPGFSISRVVIHEDPAFGREPFAYVGSLEARPSLWALMRGKLEFASLQLDDTSVNLTRAESEAGTAWNFAELLRRTKFEASARVACTLRPREFQIRRYQVGFLFDGQRSRRFAARHFQWILAAAVFGSAGAHRPAPRADSEV